MPILILPDLDGVSVEVQVLFSGHRELNELGKIVTGTLDICHQLDVFDLAVLKAFCQVLRRIQIRYCIGAIIFGFKCLGADRL